VVQKSYERYRCNHEETVFGTHGNELSCESQQRGGQKEEKEDEEDEEEEQQEQEEQEQEQEQEEGDKPNRKCIEFVNNALYSIAPSGNNDDGNERSFGISWAS
jgi:hypothetical protein